VLDHIRRKISPGSHRKFLRLIFMRSGIIKEWETSCSFPVTKWAGLPVRSRAGNDWADCCDTITAKRRERRRLSSVVAQEQLIVCVAVRAQQRNRWGKLVPASGIQSSLHRDRPQEFRHPDSNPRK